MVAGRLRLRLFSHDELVLMPGEVVRLLRHRKMMAFYLCGIIALIWLNWDQRMPGASLELHAPPQIGAVLVGGMVPVLGLLRADRMARRGHDLVVSASLLFLLATILGFASYSLLAVPLGLTPLPSLQHALTDIAFNYVMAEIIGGLAVHFIAPALLRELRHFSPAPDAVIPSAAPVSDASRQSAPSVKRETQPAVRELEPKQTQVRVANRLFEAGDILLIQAERTHVVLTTAGGRQILPGPFAAVVAQMPVSLGQQVSRSDWVATSAVLEVQRQGRDVVLLCQYGHSVRVATSRQAKLRDWLDRLAEGSHQAVR